MLPIVLVKIADLNPDEKAVLEELGIESRVGQIFRCEPLETQLGPSDMPAKKSIPHDLIFIFKKSPDNEEDMNEYIQELSTRKRHDTRNIRYAYVYNCVHPEFSEYGSVLFDKDFKYRIG